MSDLISRQAAIDTLEGCQQYKVSTEDYAVDYAQAKTELMMLPAADVVEVVRCKDCKYFEHNGYAEWCNGWDGITRKDSFCSFGERRTDAEIH